jgi:AraC-like DNA-binding protein
MRERDGGGAMEPAPFGATQGWTRVAISSIEDLSDAVYGAGLQATQMAKGGLSGSLAFAERNGITYSSGLILGTVTLTGPLSPNQVTLGVGLHFSPGSWHWMTEVTTGEVGLFHAGDEHDCHYTPGALYATVTLDEARLEEEAAKEELVLDRRTLGGTGLHARHLHPNAVAWLRQRFERIHADHYADHLRNADVCAVMLQLFLRHFGRAPSSHTRGGNGNAHAAIVRRARVYIAEHLGRPIALDDIASAAFASRRTLYRAFAEILNDTPQSYVRRLRLHRIRHDLATDGERACTIALVATQWGMTELGRMSGWYRELFGERPSETHAQARDFRTRHTLLQPS